MDRMSISNFIDYIEEGREIELLFHKAWYFFGTHEIKKEKKETVRVYMFYQISDGHSTNHLLLYTIEELLHVKLDGHMLSDAIAEISDYIVY